MSVEIPRRRRTSLRIDLSPLIDCVFQLLIFFMLSSTLISPAIELALPEAMTEDDVPQPEIVVTVDPVGNFYLNAEPIDAAELETRLRPLIASSERKVVTFAGDEDTHHKHFVHALDAARASGAIHLDVSHDRLAGTSGSR